MNILVVDSDLAIKEYYSNLLESEFQGVRLQFISSARVAISEANESGTVDLVLTDSKHDDMNFFEFLETLVEKHIPVIVVSSHVSERFIVECLRTGAMDYISKENIKLGHLPVIMTRALLEADRWQRIFKAGQQIHHRPEFLKVNQRIRSFLQDEQREQKRNMLSRGLVPEEDKSLREGEKYFVVFLYLQLFIPEGMRQGMDGRVLAELRNRIMNGLTGMPTRYGGQLWTLKEDGCFFGFLGEGHVPALLSAIEMQSSVHVFNLSAENLTDRVSISIGMSGGQVIYRENKGDLYSEALNLSAHMAFLTPEDGQIRFDSEFYENLWSRAKKYCYKQDDFEGKEIYRFEHIA